MAVEVEALLLFHDDIDPREDWRGQARTATLAELNARPDWTLDADDLFTWDQAAADQYNGGQLDGGAPAGAAGWYYRATFTGDETATNGDGVLVYVRDIDAMQQAELNLSNGIRGVHLVGTRPS